MIENVGPDSPPILQQLFNNPESLGEIDFPTNDLNILSKCVKAISWSVPVEPDRSLEKVLLACNALAESGDYINCPYFNQFFEDVAVNVFDKLLCDKAGQRWDDSTNHCIFGHCLLTVRIFALLVGCDYADIFRVVEPMFDPESNFHLRCNMDAHGRNHVRFGNGFNYIERFDFIASKLPELGSSTERTDLMCIQGKPIPVPLIYTYLKPFRLCSNMIENDVRKHYIAPIIDIVLNVIKCLNENDIRQLLRDNQRSSLLGDFSIIRILHLCSIESSTFAQESVDDIHLDLILKVMKIDLFGAKMSALTEINNHIEALNRISAYSYISKEKLLNCLKANNILSNLLRENLHQPQYVKKVARIVRFLLENDSLSFGDLDEIWRAQTGRHDVIAQNVEFLIIQSVKYFSAGHLDQLFDSFKATLLGSPKQQQERVIRLIPRLVAEDPTGLAQNAAAFLWELSIRPLLLPEINLAALEAHYEVIGITIRIGLDFAERWLGDFAEIIKSNTNDIATDCSARQMVKVLLLLDYISRREMLNRIISKGLIDDCIKGLKKFVDKHIKSSRANGLESVSSPPPSTTSTLSRGEVTANMFESISALKSTSSEPFHHATSYCCQIRDRLDLIYFLGTESDEHLTITQLNQLWNCLVGDVMAEAADHETSSNDTDSLVGGLSSSFSDTIEGRNISFKWFSPATNRLVLPFASIFFQKNIMKIKPELFTPAAIELFKDFFVYVNFESGESVTDPDNPMGIDYLWNIVLTANDKVAQIGIEMLLDILIKTRMNGTLGSNFTNKCRDCLLFSFNKILENLRIHGFASEDGSLCRIHSTAFQQQNALAIFVRDIEQDLVVIDRVIRFLRCFLIESERNFVVLRSRLPLFQSWCGSTLLVTVKFEAVVEDTDVDRELNKIGANGEFQYSSPVLYIESHANETLYNLRRRMLILRLMDIFSASNFFSESDDEADKYAKLANLADKFAVKLDIPANIPHNISLSTYLLINSGDFVFNEEDGTNSVSFDAMLVLSSKCGFQCGTEDLIEEEMPERNISEFSSSSSPGNCSSPTHERDEEVDCASPPLALEGNENSLSRSSLLGSSSHLQNSLKSDLEPFDHSDGEVPNIFMETNLPDYIISEDENFVRLLFDIGNMTFFLDMGELRDRIFDVLFSIPINLTYQKTLQTCFVSPNELNRLKDLLNTSLGVLNLSGPSGQNLDDFEHGGITQQFYFLQIIYANLYPSISAKTSDPAHINFSEETFSYMHSFLRNGGLSTLLSSPILQNNKALPTRPLSRLVFLWICRLVNLCLYCCMYSLNEVMAVEDPHYRGLLTLCQMVTQSEMLFCDSIMTKYAQAYAIYARSRGVNCDEIRTHWLVVPSRSCRRLRDFIWMISCVHSASHIGSPVLSESDISASLKANLTPSQDSGCISPRVTAFSSQPADPPTVTCTFSTTCGLKPAALQTFFYAGQWDTNLFSIDCLRMLIPTKDKIDPNNTAIPHLLNLQSGRTPGCLSTSAIASLTYLLSLSPDTDLIDCHNDYEVLKSWLDFFRSILFQSSSTNIRRLSAVSAHAVISCGQMSFSSHTSVLEICEFTLKYLIQTIKEADYDNTLHCSEGVKLFLCIIGHLVALNHIPPFIPQIFVDEWNWLFKTIKTNSVAEDENFPTSVHFTIPDLVTSHLRLCTCLIKFQDDNIFNQSVEGHIDLNLLDVIMKSILFPAAVRRNELLLYKSEPSATSETLTSGKTLVSICKALAPPPPSVASCAFSLLGHLMLRSPALFVPLIADRLSNLLFEPTPMWLSWENADEKNFGDSVEPESTVECIDVGPSYVGLRNPGSLCYMNAVLQQVFAILPIRNAILSAPVLHILKENGVNTSELYSPYGSIQNEMNETRLTQLCSLFGLQDMFAFLAYTRQTFYEPVHFWKHFKLWGSPTTYNEQHDAQEFFSCFVDTIDEALKLCGKPKIIEQYLGGIFADQKECFRCHQVYSREESFLAISVDVQNRTTLSESLEDYVKSDLLEGNNAYFCEKCDEKVAARKRTCIKSLPQILTIHLKRFIYDYEQDVSQKSDDFFSFPMNLDMAPYTVEGLASRDEPSEGNTNTSDSRPISPAPESNSVRQVTRYVLRGVVVHSGKATGGHYFSYIRSRDQKTGKYLWHVFNDSKVSEVDLSSPTIIHDKWFGGVNPSPRSFALGPYKRYWSAYMLFYEREDFKDAFDVPQISHSLQSLSLLESNQTVSPCPALIARKIYAQNIEYFSKKALISHPFKTFMYGVVDRFQLCTESPEVSYSLANLVFHYCFELHFKQPGFEPFKWVNLFLNLLEKDFAIQKRFTDIAVFSPFSSPHDIFFKCSFPQVRFVYATLLFQLMRPKKDEEEDANELTERILQKILNELPNCFKPRGDVLEDAFIGPFNVYDSYSYTLMDNVKSLIKNSSGGQLFSLLLDYMQMSDENVERLENRGVHADLIKIVMERIPKSTFRKLSETTVSLANYDPLKSQLEKLESVIGSKVAPFMQESARMFIISEVARSHVLTDTNPALSFAPSHTSPAFIAIDRNRSHLFYLPFVLTVHYSPINQLLKCLQVFFWRASKGESALTIDSIMTDVDLPSFTRVLINNCVNQGSAMTVAALLFAIIRNSQPRSEVVLKEVVRMIFQQNDFTHQASVLSDLSITILMELLNCYDAPWEYRMLLVFDRHQGVDILSRISLNTPTLPRSLGMRLLRAIAAITFQFQGFREFFYIHNEIGLRLFQILESTAECIDYPNSIASQKYEETLCQALNVLCDLHTSSSESVDPDAQTSLSPGNYMVDVSSQSTNSSTSEE
nr:ubiquitin carboxyl terminal hydrolase [Hymenolepis microstoma]